MKCGVSYNQSRMLICEREPHLEGHHRFGSFEWPMSKSDKPLQPEHKLVSLSRMDTMEWRTECTCGAVWKQPASRSEEFMHDLFESHKAYARRMATRVD